MIFEDIKNLISTLGSLSTLVTCAVAVYAIFGTRRQLKIMTLNHEGELRPYVSVKLVLSKGKTEAAEIQLHNSGRTSARDVKVTFPPNQVWNNVKKPTYPFLGSGISVLNPGETVRYFLGPLRGSAELTLLKTTSTIVWLEYQDIISKKVLADEFRVSLGDQTYEINTNS